MILLVLTYGCETRVVNKEMVNRLRVNVKAIESRMISITRKDRKTNRISEVDLVERYHSSSSRKKMELDWTCDEN